MALKRYHRKQNRSYHSVKPSVEVKSDDIIRDIKAGHEVKIYLARVCLPYIDITSETMKRLATIILERKIKGLSDSDLCKFIRNFKIENGIKDLY